MAKGGCYSLFTHHFYSHLHLFSKVFPYSLPTVSSSTILNWENHLSLTRSEDTCRFCTETWETTPEALSIAPLCHHLSNQSWDCLVPSGSLLSSSISCCDCKVTRPPPILPPFVQSTLRLSRFLTNPLSSSSISYCDWKDCFWTSLEVVLIQIYSVVLPISSHTPF